MLMPLVALLALSATVPPTSQEAPTLRLPTDVQPVKQTVDLTLDPAKDSFSGHVEIDVRILTPIRLIWLNARGLDLSETYVTIGGKRRTAAVIPGSSDFVGLSVNEAIEPGPGLIETDFSGTMTDADQQGIFAATEGNRRYLFTQMEPRGARRAFPCFDEPDFKIPWRITLRVPTGAVALSNAPEDTVTRDGALTVTSFKETPPMPSYLVAMAAGPFEIVDLGRVGRAQTPARLVVPQGRTSDVAWARETTPRIVEYLETYFDRAYPFAKLDQIAVPDVGFAMENPGLVTYAEQLMVLPKTDDTISNRRSWAAVCAHELAHMWFGDLVTMRWWNDLWLNESFAEWMSAKAVAQLWPEWRTGLERVQAHNDVLTSDSLASARCIRQPVEDEDGILAAFDMITYQKGQAVLQMFEAWLGEDALRSGVRSYMSRNAWGNATADDFLTALSQAAGKEVEPAFQTFLDQAGAPNISAEVNCRGRTPEVILRQEPYRALGADALQGRLWQVPVCLVYPRGGDRAEQCTLLTSQQASIALATRSCPGWVLPNAKLEGYFRVAFSLDEASRMLDSGELEPAERMGLAEDAAAQVRSGALKAGDALRLAERLAHDPDPHVIGAAIDVIESLARLVPETDAARYATWVRQVLGPKAEELGWSARDGDSDDTRLLRARILRVVGVLGNDGALGAAAAERTRRWLTDPGSVDPDMVGTLLAVTAHHADPAMFEQLRKAALETQDRARQHAILGALGWVGDADLGRQALALLFDQHFSIEDTVRIPIVLGQNPATQGMAWAFAKAHYDEIDPHLPLFMHAYAPMLASDLCDKARLSEVDDFFRPRMAKVEAGTYNLDLVLESIASCAAVKEAQHASLAAGLRSQVSP
jgi:alanyl aminopeptidase